jgi:ubiquitin carboxyl-terminal hydrolase 14
MKLQLIGTAGEIQAPPTAAALKEDEEKPTDNSLEQPIGLQNLGNTCFMNSTLQCLRKIPELRDGLGKVPQQGPVADNDRRLAMATNQLFRSLDAGKESQAPFLFLRELHSSFPQFAEKGPQGGLMQHDAEECWNAVLMALARSVPRLGAAANERPSQENSLVSDLFQGVMETRFKCEESEAEPEVVKDEPFQKLTCNIDGKVAFMLAGMEMALSGSVDKTASTLGRSAQWNKVGRVKQLPYYLTVQFVRFAWRQELNKGKGDKVKIVKPVSFPMDLDMYPLCTPELKAQLDPARRIADRKDKADAGGAEPMDTTPDAHPMSNATGRYELVAVLSHMGRSSDSGHYVAWTKYEPKNPKPNDRKDLWVLWDDDKPSFVLQEDIKKLSGAGGADHHIGYLFLYRSVK